MYAEDSDDGKPKRTFLKRKSASVAASAIPVKQYKYYADAFVDKKEVVDQEIIPK